MGDYDLTLSTWAAQLDAQNVGNALALEIGERVADGELLRDIARNILGVAKAGRLMMWMRAEPSRYAAYIAGLEARADELAFEVVEIADEQKQTVCTRTGTQFDPDVPRDALRVKARQWLAGKWDRGRFGESNVTIGINAGGGSLVSILMGMPVHGQTQAIAPTVGRIDPIPMERAAIEHVFPAEQGLETVGVPTEAAVTAEKATEPVVAEKIANAAKRGRKPKSAPVAEETDPNWI